jgi:DNA-binding NarL/FixJ family response regulator
VISILVVDDTEVVRRQIGILLATQRDLNVVAEASNAFEAIEKTEQYQPDIVLLDISMPELNGLQAIPLIKKAAPNAEILILTQYDNRFFAREAFVTGAGGFLAKSDVSAELVIAVREVFAKRSFVSQKYCLSVS